MFLTWSRGTGPASLPSGSPDQSSLKVPKSKVRTRSGCNTCRRRRVKCDEVHPACMRCQRSNNRCSYELRLQWEDEMRMAGKCHGRTGVRSKRDSLQHAAAGDGESQKLTRANRKDKTHQHGNGDFLSICSPPSSHSPPPTRSCRRLSYHTHYESWKKVTTVSRTLPVLPWSVGIPDADDVCLSFYESVMCAVGVTVDDERYNPLRSTVMRLVFRSETAYYAVLMASAHYLRSFESRFDVMEMQIRQRVLGGLRRALMKEAWDWEDVLVPTIFLCSSAISNSCDASWVKHMTCFQLIVKEMTQSRRKAPHIPPFFISYFASHLVLAKSLFPIDEVLPVAEVPTSRIDNAPSTDAPKVSWTSTKDLAKVMREDSLHDIDIWTGLSGHMLLLINEVLSLKQDAQALNHQEHGVSAPQNVVEQRRSTLELKVTTLEARLATATQKVPVSLHQGNGSPESAHRCRLLEGTAEAYRLAAFLLLSEVASPAFLGYTLSTNRASAQTCDPTLRQQYVDRIFELVNEVVSSLDYLPVSWPLWPLFIASCCCPSDQESKTTALELFHAAKEKAPYENIPRALTLVELLWQRRELHGEGEGSIRIGQFEWEPVMEFLGWQTSFA